MKPDEAGWRERVGKFVRPLQVIVASLVVGSVVFLTVVLVITAARRPGVGNADSWTMTWIALAFLGVMVVVRSVVPGAIVRQGRRKIAQGIFQLPQARQASQQPSLETLTQMGEPGMLLVLFQIKTIIGAAIVEGVTFFLLIVYLIEGHSVALGLAVALILAIALHMPSPRGVTHWIEDQLRLMDEERSMTR